MQNYQQADKNPFMSPDRDLTLSQINGYMVKIYNWMAIGLALSALTAWISVNSFTVFSYFFDVYSGSPTMLFFICLVGELALVVAISAGIKRLQVRTAAALFVLYACLNGFTLSPILMAYTSASVTKAFALTAATFLAASVYGAATKRDLTSMGSFMFMGLIGILVASLINIFLQSAMIDFVVSYVGVVVFVGLTAYDTQKLRNMMGQAANDTTVAKMAIFGALTLYLDFINLFLMLLRVFGDRR
jgi:FtsH-binding integral membrane protein